MGDTKARGLPEGGKSRRIYLQLRDAIAQGAYPALSFLPGEQRLALDFNVSRVTVRRALLALQDEGWIERRAGSGTRVLQKSEDSAPIGADMTTLLPQLSEMSRRTDIRLLHTRNESAPRHVAMALDLESGSGVQKATRVRLIKDVPFSHLTTYVPADIAARYEENDLADTPLFQLLERADVRIAEAHQSVSATLAAPEVADALEVSVGAALLSLTRVVQDQTGRGVEYLSALYRPDLFRLDMTLARVGQSGDRHWEPRIGTPEGTP